MKHLRKILLGSLILVGLPLGWTGCVGGGGVVYGGGPWFGDGVWVDGGGRGWYGGHGGDAYVHPGGGGGRR
jgi:hypothetical protein